MSTCLSLSPDSICDPNTIKTDAIPCFRAHGSCSEKQQLPLVFWRQKGGIVKNPMTLREIVEVVIGVPVALSLALVLWSITVALG